MARSTLHEQDFGYANDPGALLERATPSRARAVLWLGVLFFALAIGWAAVAELDEVTKGIGKVIPSRQVQVVQNLEGGIVSELMIKEGQVVEPDEVLLRIDDTRFSSSYRERQVSYLALQAKLARLRAEAEGGEFAPPAGLADESPAVVERERQLFDSHRRHVNSQVDVLEQQAVQKRQELLELRARLSGLRENQKLLGDELQMTRPLVAKGAVSEVEVLRLERKAVEVRTELEAIRLAIPRIEAALDEIGNKIANVEIAFRNESREQLNEVAAELAGMTESAVALEDRVNRTLVRAPVRGTVKRLLVNTVGGVVQPGSDLVEIVPLEDSLLVEAQIRPADIAFLHPGQQAMVKLTAYDFLIYGGLDAQLEHISADTIIDDRGDSYYVIRVRTQKNYLGTDAEPLPIIPGMLAQVDILTGKKTVLHYLMKPVLRARVEALRER
ncbi:MAG TPA: HlyD family type I secretion periplasmic adaptor subunit [Gammaproteobacteria bacterium]